MEIEVGEYVRIDKSNRFLGIGKVIKIVGNTVYIKMHITMPISFSEDEINRYKHSSNIKDLIEVGDIIIIYLANINEELIVPIDKYFKDSETFRGIVEGKIELLEILTKEQFEQNSYKLEE